MSPEEKELLYLIAQMAIATVTLSGITMMVAISGRKLEAGRYHRLINSQLRMAFLVTMLSVLPLMFAQLGLSDQLLWRSASCIYLLLITIFGVYAVTQRIMPTGSLAARLPANLAIASAAILLSINLWLAEPWPYILQLFLAWIASMVVFLIFVADILGLVEKEQTGL